MARILRQAEGEFKAIQACTQRILPTSIYARPRRPRRPRRGRFQISFPLANKPRRPRFFSWQNRN
jgi:hypothetical protein